MKAIIAHSNFVIGIKDQIPWHFSLDYRFFKEMTFGESVIMGANTYKSIIKKYPLGFQDRHNIVISTTIDKVPNGEVYTVDNFPFSKFKDSWVIGGSKIYQAFKPYITEFYVTEIEDYLVPISTDLVKIPESLFDGFTEKFSEKHTCIDRVTSSPYVLNFKKLKKIDKL